MRGHKYNWSTQFTCDKCKQKKSILDAAIKWLCEDCYSELECKWLNSLPAEDQPLDDELPDFKKDFAEEFDTYLKEKWCIEVEEE